MFDLHGRVAIITGASVGLGRQFALALAGQGADIVILARRYEKLLEVAEEVKAKGVRCLPVKCDVTKLDELKAAVDATIAEFGKVDILVNNAGGGPIYPILETPDDYWHYGMELEVTAVFNGIRECAKHMVKQGYGRIINIASLFGKVGSAKMPLSNYCTAKGALINMTREVAGELSKYGITCNCLCPGFFPSESNDPQTMENLNDMICDRVPMARPGVDGELDSTIIYLAADESTYVNGVILSCDGGWTCV